MVKYGPRTRLGVFLERCAIVARLGQSSRLFHSLGKLRHAVAFQIGLWDIASEIAGMDDADLGRVLEWINATRIVADSGLELGPEDWKFFQRRRRPLQNWRKTLGVSRPVNRG